MRMFPDLLLAACLLVLAWVWVGRRGPSATSPATSLAPSPAFSCSGSCSCTMALEMLTKTEVSSSGVLCVQSADRLELSSGAAWTLLLHCTAARGGEEEEEEEVEVEGGVW